MKELILKIRKYGYSKFGQYIGLCPMLLMGGVGITNSALQLHDIVLTVMGGSLIVGSIMLFIYSIRTRKN